MAVSRLFLSTGCSVREKRRFRHSSKPVCWTGLGVGEALPLLPPLGFACVQ